MNYTEDKLRAFLSTNGHVVLEKTGGDYILRSFTEQEIGEITFGYRILLGKGAFGEVYRGILESKRPVAVKRYINGTRKEEFAREVIVHSQINHKNVVRLLGCCTEENALMIVMEFICNGNLEDFLHCKNGSCLIPLPLHKRLDIAIGSAEVLAYMHSMYCPALHGDIKPANILLDENLVPKISDFGIARLLSADEIQHTSSIIGCRGYVDPIYCQSGVFNPKSDVYSFGVVLLELITWKTAKYSCNGKARVLVRDFLEAYRTDGSVMAIFDEEDYRIHDRLFLQKASTIAVECLQLDITKRPNIRDILSRLQIIAADHSCRSKPSGKTTEIFEIKSAIFFRNFIQPDVDPYMLIGLDKIS
ncbi:hypothetical protein PR202_ga20956 [Eleusine coracana subsp. coracana]|uniref:Protein kinase domain-containing protein n=1 Tax=Eleusine coracana subsp. coracana TaxID=191504 RepID=A0AAV5D038_ELECO|nr:hypothetical protein PR202_ga20956 [Eleusine coracana subsp. coracana]